VVDSTNHGTLDFHDTTAGVTIDLRLDQGQPQAIGGGGTTLSLYGAIADLIGTPYEVLRGDDLDNIIRGLGGDDVIITGAGNSILIGGGGDVSIAGPAARGAARARLRVE
jgi:hypothetical protein